MTGHRALEKKQITQGNNRKVQNPSESPEEGVTKCKFRHTLLSCIRASKMQGAELRMKGVY